MRSQRVEGAARGRDQNERPDEHPCHEVQPQEELAEPSAAPGPACGRSGRGGE
ncbi:hypothetical protein ACFPRL_20010 [Pseudoclavibacter helvolus]